MAVYIPCVLYTPQKTCKNTVKSGLLHQHRTDKPTRYVDAIQDQTWAGVEYIGPALTQH